MSKRIIKYKYLENEILDKVKDYIDGTYNQHYAKGKYQATDMILDTGHGEGFCMGNILKYAMRYGKKNGKNRDDLYKIIHYAIIAICVEIKETDPLEIDEIKFPRRSD